MENTFNFLRFKGTSRLRFDGGKYVANFAVLFMNCLLRYFFHLLADFTKQLSSMVS